MEFLDSCPVCEYTQFEPFLSCTDYTVSQEQFALVCCKRCAFVFTNPRPNIYEIGRYYESTNYTPHSGGGNSIVVKLYRIVRELTLKKKLKLITRLCSTPGKILDYGCGSGEFLHTCHRAGWNVFGVDASEIARKHTQLNFNIQAVSPETLAESTETASFDVISLWHVLEHLHQLHETIELLKSRLAPAGWLLVAVPNRNSNDAKRYGQYWAAYDVPRHLYHFRPQDLETLMDRHQLKITELLPMPFDAYYVSLLSEQYQGKAGLPRYFKAFMAGFGSNEQAKNNIGTSSSVLYLIQHKLK